MPRRGEKISAEDRARYNAARRKAHAQQRAGQVAFDRGRNSVALELHRQASRRGWLVYRTGEQLGSANAYPDMTLVKGEWLLFAYCAKRLTIAQKQWADALTATGADVVVVDAAQVAQVDKWLGPVSRTKED